ncbi:SufD family Fe-S cluster assembly protein [Pelagerythrobacter aerophilus]|uniref:SufD family Fe-S cluster assembly protein n=1 Tax=Pelagerythrobacter aerophilus TaxID=2306995 RepID=A0A418NM84_9SPHN|nr:SufD family Fe-S cluster assembly protein [Pelagerythrobacter aerophilus]RIV75959.1 SufD family Fe-S cluster assembly protein [Pelagerythrobacter aerophilus]RIV80785.1 SufD family Fe-S cluster assembly protein [Pelagerythrobacter aerophilus]
MNALTALPTRKDEAWRYSAVEALAGADLDAWRAIDVPAGESYRECLTIENSEDTELRRLRFSVGEGAQCELFAVIAAGKLGRIEVEVRLAKGAHFELGGVTLGGRDTVREFVTHVIHAEPEATSNQVVRAAHWGKGTGNFLGQIDVVRDAQKTDAAQSFKGLLLEKGASVNAVPQLEIFADDVKCAHGASVGQLDEAARFYMAARGLSPELSRRLLVQAFIGDAFVALDDEAERERLMGIALAKLDLHL